MGFTKSSGDATSIQGLPISDSPPPNNGDVLKYNSAGTEWVPAPDSGTANHDLGGVDHNSDSLGNLNSKIIGGNIDFDTAQRDAKSLQTVDVSAVPPTNGQVLKYNSAGTQWEPGSDVGSSPHATNHKHGGGDEVATAIPGANSIPKSEAGGFLAEAWIPASITRDSELTAHTTDTLNPHSVTAVQVGAALLSHSHVAADITDFDTEVSNNADVTTNTTHRGLTNNPHGVTAAQAGAALVSHTHIVLEVTDFDTGVTNNADVLANTTHRGLTNNPHGVTSSDVGNGTAQWNADKVQGVDISVTPPTNGQVLKYNSAGTQWEPGSDVGGEVNSAVNIGTSGVGLFKQKTGLNIELKKINTGSTKVSITDDIANNEIDVDVVEANINHNSLSNYAIGQHRVINDAGNLATELWSASKIGSELGTKAATTHTHTASDITDFSTAVGAHSDVSANTTHRGVVSGNPHLVTQAEVGLGNVTDDAQLKRTANDISTFTEKPNPISADLLIIEDSAAAGTKKKIQAGNLPSPSIVTSLLAGHINGYILSYVTASTLTLGIGRCMDDGGTENIILTAADSLDITVSGESGLDTGTEANSTWYYVWVIKNISTSAVAGLISASATAPTLPAGFTKKRRVGVFRNDSTGAIIPFIQSGKSTTKSYGYTRNHNVLSSGGSATWADVDVSSVVPPVNVALVLGIEAEGDKKLSEIRINKFASPTALLWEFGRKDTPHGAFEKLLSDGLQIIQYQTTGTSSIYVIGFDDEV